MAVYTGTYTTDSVFKMIISCFMILTNVAAAWTIFVSGLLVAGFVSVNFISAQLLSSPPYNFNASQIGYVGLDPFLEVLSESSFAPSPLIR